jgi:hypothetical protein
MDLLKGRLQASEGSHFKSAQEDELREYRRRVTKRRQRATRLVALRSAPPSAQAAHPRGRHHRRPGHARGRRSW